MVQQPLKLGLGDHPLRTPPPGPRTGASSAHTALARAMSAALVGYRPAPCRFPLLLAISAEYANRDWSRSIYGTTSLGWQTVARAGIEVVDVPVSHAELFQSPHIDGLARRLAAVDGASSA